MVPRNRNNTHRLHRNDTLKIISIFFLIILNIGSLIFVINNLSQKAHISKQYQLIIENIAARNLLDVGEILARPYFLAQNNTMRIALLKYSYDRESQSRNITILIIDVNKDSVDVEKINISVGLAEFPVAFYCLYNGSYYVLVTDYNLYLLDSSLRIISVFEIGELAYRDFYLTSPVALMPDNTLVLKRLVNADTVEVLRIDPLSGSVIWRVRFPGNISLGSIVLANVSGGNILDVIFATNWGLFVLNGATGETIYAIPLEGDASNSGPTVADIDMDGEEEIIVGSYIDRYESPFNKYRLAYIYAIRSGNVLWRRTIPRSLSGLVYAVANIDDRPGVEIIATTLGMVYVFRPDGSYVWSREVGYIKTLSLADITGDGVPEIIIGTDAGLVALDGRNRIRMELSGSPYLYPFVHKSTLYFVGTQILWTNISSMVALMDSTANNMVLCRDSDHDGLVDDAERNLGTDPLRWSTDDDPLPDCWESFWGLNPLRDDSEEDPDGDNLTNILEYQHGTSPVDSDTDLDGLSDNAEIAIGSDPLLPDSDNDLIIDSYDPFPTFPYDWLLMIISANLGFGAVLLATYRRIKHTQE